MSKLSEAVAHARRMREIRTSLGEGKQARAASASPAKVRQARQALKLTQDAFSSLVGVSRVTVANWEAGTATPAEKHMDKIVELLLEAAQRRDTPPDLGPVEIVRLRKTWGLTQAAFAEGAGTTPRTLCSWETGRTRPGIVATCHLLESWGCLARQGRIETLEELKAAQIKNAQHENNT